MLGARMTRRKHERPAPNPRLWTLTERQAQTLRQARDAGPKGLYSGLCAGAEHAELVDGLAAEYVDRPYWTDTTRSVHDPRPIGWLSEFYLVPTTLGLELLAEDDERRAADLARRVQRSGSR